MWSEKVEGPWLATLIRWFFVMTLSWSASRVCFSLWNQATYKSIVEKETICKETLGEDTERTRESRQKSMSSETHPKQWRDKKKGKMKSTPYFNVFCCLRLDYIFLHPSKEWTVQHERICVLNEQQQQLKGVILLEFQRVLGWRRLSFTLCFTDFQRSGQ